ncbi:MAG: phosphatidylserine decarboxylase [Pedosphaera sp.]|nr:phosphatidylserine decarboxylase [Pedosphaera sp.]
MHDAPIEFFNRYTRRIETERVYGEAWLRWTLQNPFGKLALHLFAKRALFAAWYGWQMSRAGTRAKIAPFIAQFGLDTAEFVKRPEEFTSFNDFFYRKLKPGARPVAPDPSAVVFPADGRHLGFANAAAVSGVFVKGQRFDVDAMLVDTALADRYRNGAIVFSRLCPVDYHRFHFPVAGTPSEPRLLNGPLYSVNPLALREHLANLWENRRWLTRIDTADLGTVLVMEIGATNVGSAVQTFTSGAPMEKGSEKGYFQFGGSATATFFEPGRVRLSDDLLAHSAECRELYARVGDLMAMRS